MMTNQEESLKTEKASLKKLVKNMEDLKKSITEKDFAVKKAEDGASDIKKRVGDISQNLEECEKEYQGVVAGKSSGSEDKCLEDQLRDAKADVGNSETKFKQLKIKINHSEKELAKKKKLMVSKRGEVADEEKKLGIKKKDLETLKKSLELLTYEEGQMEALQKERSFELDTVQKLNDEVRILSGQLANAEFTYRDPVKNFERSKVKGVVAKLIKVRDSASMTALEVAAGGKLFNVVVDTNYTGKQLLQNGDLRRRVTIIPLNKIQSRVVPPRVQQAASRLVGEGNAELAIRLIGYDDEVKTWWIEMLHYMRKHTNLHAHPEISIH